MYEPPLHRQTDLATMHALIRARPLGLLISSGAQGLLANAIPFQIAPHLSANGTMQAHVARANGQWRDLVDAAQALVVFQGPHHYVTPSWYEAKRETGKVVPTWNYLIVQARGRPRVIEDAQWLRAQVEALTQSHEATRAEPWAVADAPADYIAAQLRAIVGIEIEIAEIKGKWKASQNRSAADRASVAAGLAEVGGEDALALAKAVAAT